MTTGVTEVEEFETTGKEEVSIGVTEAEELEVRGLAEELAKLAGNVGIELPLPKTEGALEDNAIDWDE